MLRGRGIGFQHTGTWKGSPGPAFEAKQDRSLNLTTIRLLTDGALERSVERSPAAGRPSG